MRLSSLADYAVVLMAAAARHGDGARLNATCLSVETGVPLPTAQKLTGRLATAGLLTTTRGSGGGFVMARRAADVSLADIIEAVEGPIALTACVEGHKDDCALEGSCRVRPHWAVVNDALRGAFAGVGLETLAWPRPSPEPARADLVAEAL